MTQWATFAAITGVVLALLLALSHLTQSALDGTEDAARSAPSRGEDRLEPTPRADSTESDQRAGGAGDTGLADPELAEGATTSREPSSGAGAGREEGVNAFETRPTEEAGDRRLETDLSTGMMLANVALSQGLFAVVLVVAAVYTGVPAGALGVEFTQPYLLTGLALGTAAGLVLYACNEVGSAGATRLGFDHDEELRELLAPDSNGGWLVLLFGVLPLIAFFEELLFRAALIGALSVGFDVSPWLLAVLSSAAFALGHGVQGPVGIAVTGALGFVLAAVFIYTGSLLVVVVAHYLINALEFVVHEGLGLEWGETTGS